jgi:CubicO group peptidase (beta-lactamase class C family)
VSTNEEQLLHDRLASAVAPLMKPPFGSGAAVTGVLGSVESTAALGTVLDGGPAVGNGTRFNVASVSKVLTAARIISLAHAKVIGLDDPVAKHLPGVRLIDKGGVDRAGTLTVRQLVQHRSGLPKVPKDLEQKVANRWSSPDLLRLLTDSWDLALEGTPGQDKYSNTGYALLAAIVERTRNCSFADCMAAYLSELGMTGSTFWPATLDEDAARGRVVVQGTVKFNAPGWYASRYAIPFTGLWTSMPDLARFGSIIVAASKDSASPLHAMTATDGPTLGLFRNQRLDATSLEHDGSGPGFYAALVVIPSKSLVLAMAANGGNETKEEGTAFGRIVGSAVSAVPSP